MSKFKVLLITMTCFTISCTSLFGNPSIHFNKLEHDFGTIKQEIDVKGIVKFKNNGDSDLKITKIETSCGCTGTKVNKKTIAPGEEGILEVNFNSGHYNGKITKKIYIHTNDPKNKTIQFLIIANVIK